MSKGAEGSTTEQLRAQAQKLKLYGVLANWDRYAQEPWLEGLLGDEERERQQRSLERRIRNAKLGSFKPLADFDWSWPEQIDQELVEELLSLGFLRDQANVVLLGPHGVGKTTIAQNLTYQAVLAGYTARHLSASELLNDLAGQVTPSALAKRLQHYQRPVLLAIDEVGYLSYDSRFADLLFEVVSRREGKSTVITTNRPFSEWKVVFPDATSVVALIDRLIHRVEIVKIEGKSYRKKESEERIAKRSKGRKKTRSRKSRAKS